MINKETLLISIGISYFLEKISKKQPDNTYTYGYARYSVIEATITTVILLVDSSLVIINTLKRMMNPVNINYDGMIIFAFIGVIINSLAAYFTSKKESLNQKSVNLHMLEDVLGWAVVLIGAIIIKFTEINVESVASGVAAEDVKPANRGKLHSGN